MGSLGVGQCFEVAGRNTHLPGQVWVSDDDIWDVAKPWEPDGGVEGRGQRKGPYCSGGCEVVAAGAEWVHADC